MLNSGHTTNEIDVAQCPVSWENMATVANTVRGIFWLDCTDGLYFEIFRLTRFFRKKLSNVSKGQHWILGELLLTCKEIYSILRDIFLKNKIVRLFLAL